MTVYNVTKGVFFFYSFQLLNGPEMQRFFCLQNEYSNPALYNYKNITHLYTIPYNDISLSIAEKNFKLETLIRLKQGSSKTHLFNKFKFKGKLIDTDYRVFYFKNLFFPTAESSLRDKYHKCFSCDLTKIENKISKIRVKLEVKVVYLR